MSYIVRAYKIHPTAEGPFVDPVCEENLFFLISFKTLEEAKLYCTNLLKYYNLYYRITDGVTDSWYAGHTDENGVKQLKKTNVVTTVNNEVSAKHTTNTTSSYSKSDYSSKPPGWIHPPDGWEWIGAKQEYKHQMTGIRICYRPTYNEWEVVIPPNQTKLWGFVTESLSYAFENYASYE